MSLNKHLKIATQIGFLILALFAIGCAHSPVVSNAPKEPLGTIGVVAWADELPAQEEAVTSGSNIEETVSSSDTEETPSGSKHAEEKISGSDIVDGVLFLPKEVVRRTAALGFGTLKGCIDGLRAFPVKKIMDGRASSLTGGGGGGDKLFAVIFVGLAAGFCGTMGIYEGVYYAVLPDELYHGGEGIGNTYVGARGDNPYRQNAVKEEVRRRILAGINQNSAESAQMLEERVGYEQLSTQGVDTVLDLSLERLTLVGGGFDMVDELSIDIEINVRLIKTKDKKEVYREAFNYYLEGRRLQAGHSNSKLVDHELELAYQDLAEQVVTKLSQEFPPTNPSTVSELIQQSPPVSPLTVSEK